MLRILPAFLAGAALLLLPACTTNDSGGVDSASTAPNTTVEGAWPTDRPSRVLVGPFPLRMPSLAEVEQGALFPGHRRREAERRASRDESLVEQFRAALVRDLRAGGLSADLVEDPAAVSGSGWLVRGVFTEVPAGDPTAVSLVTGGGGRVDLIVAVDDLADGAPRPIFNVSTDGAASGGSTGLAPNPYAIAARFVLDNVERGGDADALAERVSRAILARAR